MNERRVGELEIRTFQDRGLMGAAAASDIAGELRKKLQQNKNVRVVFASAPSQSEMLEHLVNSKGIDWPRVTAFHMDEYIGLDAQAPQSFGAWLEEHLFNLVGAGCVHVISPGQDPAQSAIHYAALLAERPIDMVCMGIGVNGHLAFNDPPVADFKDPYDVKIVQLDEVCRQQQVDDQCFATLGEVPATAVTLTLPRLLRTDRIFCVVPGAQKKAAVKAAMYGPLTTECPASILRTHPGSTLYLDKESDPDD